MENYIVRIYRRDDVDPDNVIGICESVERQRRATCKSIARLVSLLSPARAVPVEDQEIAEPSPQVVSDKIPMAD